MSGLLHAKAAAAAFALSASPALAEPWRITSLDGAPALGAAALEFGDEGALAGNTGCNQFSGTAQIAEAGFTVTTPLVMTRKACLEESVNRQEAALVALLSGAISVEYDPYLQQLHLSANGHEALLSPQSLLGADGTPAVFAASEAIVTGVTSRLNLRAAPATSADVVARLAAQSSHSNLGCQRLEDRDWCQLRLNTGVEGWAAADFLSPLTLGSRAKGESFDRIGRIPCAAADGAAAGQCEYGAVYEASRAILSVFVDEGAPVVLHFNGAELDAAASFGPFAASSAGAQSSATGVEVTVRDTLLEVPQAALQQ